MLSLWVYNELKLKDQTCIPSVIMQWGLSSGCQYRQRPRILIDTYRDKKGKIKPIKFDEHIVHLANKTTDGRGLTQSELCE